MQKTSETFEHLKIQTSNSQLLFKLQVKNNESLKHGQTVAFLKENKYKTESGGIIYYSTVFDGYIKKRSKKSGLATRRTTPSRNHKDPSIYRKI